MYITYCFLYCFSSENSGLYQLKNRQLSLLYSPLSEGEINIIESTFLFFSLMVLVIQYTGLGSYMHSN